MDSETEPTSLAFVDLLTNGLGGVLVLFFIASLFQKDLSWANTSIRDAAESRDRNQPFVIVARVEPMCFGPNQQVVVVEGLKRRDGLQKGGKYDWSNAHAVLVLDKKPNIGTSIRIGGVTEPASLIVEYYHGDRRRLINSKPIPIVPGEYVTVWPHLESNETN